jgi:hypothetical protein
MDKLGGRIWRHLEELGKRVWVVLLPLTAISLLFVILTYCSQRATNRPELAVAVANIYWDQNPIHARFNFANTGKKTARRGTATLFAGTTDKITKSNSSLRLGAAPIIGSGPNVMPGFGGNADMSLTVKVRPGKFLLCTIYSDETGTEYRQSFLLERDDETSSAGNSQLKEIAPFGSDLCAE